MKCYKYLIAISILVTSSIIFTCYLFDNKAKMNNIKENTISTADEDIVVEQKNNNQENEIGDIHLTREPENINISTKNNEDVSKQVVQAQKEVHDSKSIVTQNLPVGEDGNMINLINEARTLNGLGQLTFDPILYSVADIRLNEINAYFSHTRPNGSEFYTVSSALDGENLSKYGAGDAASSFNGFMNSPDHRENILYSGFTRVACKKAIIGGTVYWIQLFGY